MTDLSEDIAVMAMRKRLTLQRLLAVRLEMQRPIAAKAVLRADVSQSAFARSIAHV